MLIILGFGFFTTRSYSQKCVQCTDSICIYGAIAFALEDYPKSLQYCNDAIKLNPNDFNARLTRGQVKARLGDYRGAILDFDKAIDICPEKWGGYYYRGVTKIALGEIDSTNSACLDLSKAGELGKMEAYDLIKKACH